MFNLPNTRMSRHKDKVDEESHEAGSSPFLDKAAQGSGDLMEDSESYMLHDSWRSATGRPKAHSANYEAQLPFEHGEEDQFRRQSSEPPVHAGRSSSKVEQSADHHHQRNRRHGLPSFQRRNLKAAQKKRKEATESGASSPDNSNTDTDTDSHGHKHHHEHGHAFRVPHSVVEALSTVCSEISLSEASSREEAESSARSAGPDKERNLPAISGQLQKVLAAAEGESQCEAEKEVDFPAAFSVSEITVDEKECITEEPCEGPCEEEEGSPGRGHRRMLSSGSRLGPAGSRKKLTSSMVRGSAKLGSTFVRAYHKCRVAMGVTSLMRDEGVEEGGQLDDDLVLTGVSTAHMILLPPGLATTTGAYNFAGSNEIYAWLNESIIQTVWQDPACGNGVCEGPVEYPGFGIYGCKADCGSFDWVTPINVHITTDFDSIDHMADSDWNLCMSEPVELCWFASAQQFTDLTADFKVQLSVPDGDWAIILSAPYGGVVGSVEATGPGGEASSLVTWGTCYKNHSESSLIQCRQTCNKVVECVQEECGGYTRARASALFVDCAGVCNYYADTLPYMINYACPQLVGEILTNVTHPLYGLHCPRVAGGGSSSSSSPSPPPPASMAQILGRRRLQTAGTIGVDETSYGAHRPKEVDENDGVETEEEEAASAAIVVGRTSFLAVEDGAPPEAPPPPAYPAPAPSNISSSSPFSGLEGSSPRPPLDPFLCCHAFPVHSHGLRG
eukprot:jgi/Mesen1/2672/ME000167S01820